MASATSKPAARFGIAAIFLVHGLIQGAWVPHIPLAQQRLGVDLATFGWALLAIALGAVASMPITGVLINRFGSSRVTAVVGFLFFFAFPLPVFAPTLTVFVPALVAFGLSLGSMDVAMNAQALAFEKHIRHPVMSFFHGAYSVGAMGGASISALILNRFSALAHVTLMVVACIVIFCVAIRNLLPAGADRGRGGSSFAWPTRATIGLGSLCFLVLMSEGAVLDWSAIHLRQKFGLEAHVAALGYAMFACGMAAARFTGDVIRARFGSVSLVRWSALLSAAGLVAALGFPIAPLSIAAYAFAGLGIGNIVPVFFGGGGRLEPEAPGRGIAAVLTMGYAGFVVGPPFIGMAAQAAGLPVALGLTVAACLIIAGAANIARAADVR